MSWTQLEGNIRAGLTPATAVDVSEEVTRFLVSETMQTVTRRRSFAQAEETSLKSGTTGQLGIDLDTDDSDVANSFRELCRTAMHDNSTATDGRRPGEIWISGTERDEAVSGTNKQLYGWALVNDLDIFGGTVGEVRSQSKSWPLRDIQLVEVEYPADELS